MSSPSNTCPHVLLTLHQKQITWSKDADAKTHVHKLPHGLPKATIETAPMGWLAKLTITSTIPTWQNNNMNWTNWGQAYMCAKHARPIWTWNMDLTHTQLKACWLSQVSNSFTWALEFIAFPKKHGSHTHTLSIDWRLMTQTSFCLPLT